MMMTMKIMMMLMIMMILLFLAMIVMIYDSDLYLSDHDCLLGFLWQAYVQMFGFPVLLVWASCGYLLKIDVNEKPRWKDP